MIIFNFKIIKKKISILKINSLQLIIIKRLLYFILNREEKLIYYFYLIEFI